MGVGVLGCRAISMLTSFLDRFDSDVDNCSDIEHDACECMNDVVFADSRRSAFMRGVEHVPVLSPWRAANIAH